MISEFNIAPLEGSINSYVILDRNIFTINGLVTRVFEKIDNKVHFHFEPFSLINTRPRLVSIIRKKSQYYLHLYVFDNLWIPCVRTKIDDRFIYTIRSDYIHQLGIIYEKSEDLINGELSTLRLVDKSKKHLKNPNISEVASIEFIGLCIYFYLKPYIVQLHHESEE